ncbi:hypothetical protein [Microbacterium cremeum]|uniref:hypothetical protein n=1 Tax=Microbacterium cremeum TaxID=2782169 RepID=UPI0018871DE4|nr:hypothetical protein [Microbacterium cremeum]
MHGFRTANFSPIDWAEAAFSTPLTSLLLAVIVAGAAIVFVGSRPSTHVVLSEGAARSFKKRYAPERHTLAIAAIAVIVVFAAENVIRGYVINLGDAVSWWRFATPVASSVLAVAILAALIVLRGSAPSEARVVTGARRTWTTFGPRVGLILCGAVLLLLVATTIAAGVTSAADSRGQYIWLEIPIPNEAEIDPIRLWYYGWAFGVPVLIALAALLVATALALRVNAARPFIRPETVAAERGLRSEVASGAVAVATAGMLLALAGAWRLIARAGSPSQLWVEGENGGNPYDAAWRYAELAAVVGWLAPILEVIAFTLLFLVVARPRQKWPSPSPDEQRDDPVDAARADR